MNRVSISSGMKHSAHLTENMSHQDAHQRGQGMDLFADHQTSFVSVGRRRWILRAGLAEIAGPTPLQPSHTCESGEQNGTAKRATSVIQIWLSGGSSQFDMWDMKQERSPEIRGTLQPGDLAATVFSHLAINLHSHWITPSGRPVPLVEVGQRIAGLTRIHSDGVSS